jgi:ketosteroid isomerase-like protein
MRAGLFVAAASLLGVNVVESVGIAAGEGTAVIDEKFRAFNRHDTAAIEKLYAAAARLHSPDYPDLEGNGPIAETYRTLFETIPDARDEVTAIEAGPQHVYAQFVLRGHLGGETKKPITVRIMSVYRVEGGRITQDDTYYDRKR